MKKLWSSMTLLGVGVLLVGGILWFHRIGPDAVQTKTAANAMQTSAETSKVAGDNKPAPKTNTAQPNEEQPNQARVNVNADMEIVKNDQAQVDAGHSPWQLDPVFVASVFVNTGLGSGKMNQNEVPDSAFVLSEKTEAEAVVKVNAGPVKQVYLKRLVEQNEKGIWTVIGYDPKE
ncbi:hypothetical protein REC12_08015 [Desulfosporosinus sp. PR]|uniref:hypothetical protein n=1 Tax=Candidatus Desulfosporosinus nitrosoreducens TaxID=3401928 RepID=UPI0027E8E83F|nr:hypothetical protein [Desulfosporosinus sp. PR]MDQ7093531.1 hypothetical protein [Desulfosporosinus sp. PR]